jgi:hypothetical protein
MDESQVKPAAVIELLGRDGRVQSVQRITHWPARIGRSPACDVVLDDPHLAAEHAELDWRAEGGIRLTLLDSLNGGSLGAKRLAAGEAVDLSGPSLLHLGASSLRLRSTADPLAAEQPLQVAVERHWALVPALFVLLLVLLGYDRWAELNPDARWVDYTGSMLSPIAFCLAWAGLWSLATQLFQHRFPFTAHLRRILLTLCVMVVLSWALPLLAYAFSWPRLMALDELVLPVGFSALLWWHARVVWPSAERIMGWGIVGLLVLGLGLRLGNRQEQQYLFGPPYLASLAPPALRLASPKPPEALIDALKPLQAELAKQARRDNQEFNFEPGE